MLILGQSRGQYIQKSQHIDGGDRCHVMKSVARADRVFWLSYGVSASFRFSCRPHFPSTRLASPTPITWVSRPWKHKRPKDPGVSRVSVKTSASADNIDINTVVVLRGELSVITPDSYHF